MSQRSATPDAVPLGELSRALVIKLAHLGDVLLASPVISVLKRYAPGLEVDALVYSATAPMLSGHPDLSRLFTIDRDWNRLGLIAFAVGGNLNFGNFQIPIAEIVPAEVVEVPGDIIEIIVSKTDMHLI